ncbi:FUSC family protein [Lichenihabitans sp. Uapishka_5]|uniref:FUSC family protein n=1 Tax=Lichenihabitans sp. Uapishka_5 TaxID=3037302 RepID=UPI0029E7FFDA|nr:FUSC family protein [Lichenihabitans sp. Uapishka_5]MDX7953547.1 FUSC family protein [Lichenihabitans sp. Uapishka_5]
MTALPRPDTTLDPHFALRCAIGITLTYVLVEPLGVQPASILPAMAVSQICSQRGDYSPSKTFVGAVITIAIIWMTFGVTTLVREEMLVFVSVILAILYGAFYFLLRTGNPLAILVIIFTTLLSVLSAESPAAAEAMRDAYTVTSIVTALLVPVLNLVLPVSRVDASPAAVAAAPAGDPQAGMQALLRVLALAPILFGLWFVFPPSDVIMPIMACLVLAYPTRSAQRTETFERLTATMLGGVISLAILLLFSWQAQFPALYLLIFLVALWFTRRMVTGPASVNTYQVSLTVIAGLVSTGMTSSHPMQDAVQRLVLTFGGTAMALAGLVFLASILVWRPRRTRAGNEDLAYWRSPHVGQG